MLFPFGYGLSYTQYKYADLKVSASGTGMLVNFRITHAGAVAGSEVAEVYATLPAGANEPPKRLVGWKKVTLAAGKAGSWR